MTQPTTEQIAELGRLLDEQGVPKDRRLVRYRNERGEVVTVMMEREKAEQAEKDSQ